MLEKHFHWEISSVKVMKEVLLALNTARRRKFWQRKDALPEIFEPRARSFV